MFLHDNGCICPKPESLTEVGEVSVTVAGGPVFYAQEGGSVELQCEVSGLVRPPHSLLWRHEEQVISPRTWQADCSTSISRTVPRNCFPSNLMQ